MLTLKTCKENTLCIDCRNKTCMHAGQAIADCPKYSCDNKTPLDCKHCTFLKKYTTEMRRLYAAENT